VSRGVFLRLAGAGDADALAELERAACIHPWSADQVRAELVRATPDAVLVLEGREGMLAYCAYRIVLDEMHVMNLAVRPEARRQGLGRFLLEAALRRAARAGAQRALLEVRTGNAAARALYADCGFVRLGQRKLYFGDPPEDALVLVRDAVPGQAADGSTGGALGGSTLN
jgi:ribosomal-protein-alanine N-acetyltransferase